MFLPLRATVVSIWWWCVIAINVLINIIQKDNICARAYLWRRLTWHITHTDLQQEQEEGEQNQQEQEPEHQHSESSSSSAFLSPSPSNSSTSLSAGASVGSTSFDMHTHGLWTSTLAS